MKRISELDALRGIALFGILLVNIFVFHAPLAYYGEFYGAFEGIQLLAVNGVVDFAAGKFLFIFAFLFGYGIVLQGNSCPKTFHSYFAKRMLVLLLFGVLHIVLFWFGDILASYALLGLLAIPLLRLSDRNILLLGFLLILFRPLFYVGVVRFGWPTDYFGKTPELAAFIAVFQQGSYLEILQLRMQEFLAFLPENLVWFLPKTFGLFLLGIFAARKQLFTRIKERSATYAIASSALFLISLGWVFWRPGLFSLFDLEATPFWRPVLIAANVFFETTHGLAYITGFSLLFQNSDFLTPIFAKAGRLALTNYILQSLICVLIFYGYGLGYFAKLLPTDLLLISLVIFGFNLAFSSIYLKYRSIGPLEYLWRSMIAIGNR